MKNKLIHIRSIGELHRHYECGKPQHPLISIIDLKTIRQDLNDQGIAYQMDL